MKHLRTYVIGLRPWFWWAAIAPGVAGYLWAASSVSGLDILAIVYILGFGLAGFAELANEIYDSDYDKHQRQFSAFGINSSGNLNIASHSAFFRRNAKRILLLHFVITISVGWLMLELPLSLLLFGALLGWGYSARPLRMKRNALSNIVAKVVGYGLVGFHIGTSLAGADITGLSIGLAISIGLIQCGFNGIADVNDVNADRANGLFTLPVVVGPTISAIIYMIFCVFGLSLLLLYRLLTPGADTTMYSILVTVALIAACSTLTVNVVRSAFSDDSKRLSQLHLISGITMMVSAIWLVI